MPYEVRAHAWPRSDYAAAEHAGLDGQPRDGPFGLAGWNVSMVHFLNRILQNVSGNPLRNVITFSELDISNSMIIYDNVVILTYYQTN